MRDFFKRHYFFIKFAEICFDFIFIIVSFFIGFQLAALISNVGLFESLATIFRKLFSENIYIVKTQIMYFILNMFFFSIFQSFVTNKTYKEAIKSVIVALLMSNVSAIILSYLFDKSFVPPLTIIYIFISQIIVFMIYKYVYSLLISRVNKRRVLIIGTKKDAEKLAIKFLHKKDKDKILNYVIFEDKGKIKEDIISFIDMVDSVIVSHSLTEENKNNIITYCISQKHKEVILVPKLYEISIIKSNIQQVDDTPVFVSKSMYLSITQRFIKRTFDLFVSILMFIILLPVLTVVSLTVKLLDKGPIFYKQERISRGNKPFMLYKFRTMIVDAEKATGPVWQMENDPRITKIGKILRKTRIDELPQLINVIRGDMSLIGPRPEREIFIQEFIKDIPDFKYRINVKPGITGLAQVKGKYNSEPIDKLRFDLIYIRKYSIWLDIKILILTVKAIFDRDSSATLGLPSLEEVAMRRSVDIIEIENGYKVVSKNEQK